jgi:hypothetical protein
VDNLLASLHMWDRRVGEVSVSIRRGRSSGRLWGTGCAKRFFDYRKDRRLRYSPLVSTEGACKPVRNGGIDALIQLHAAAAAKGGLARAGARRGALCRRWPAAGMAPEAGPGRKRSRQQR